MLFVHNPALSHLPEAGYLNRVSFHSSDKLISYEETGKDDDDVGVLLVLACSLPLSDDRYWNRFSTRERYWMVPSKLAVVSAWVEGSSSV